MREMRFVMAALTLGLTGPALAQDQPPPPRRAHAGLDQGWDRDVGLVVELNNPFQSASLLEGYGGLGVAVFVAFSPTGKCTGFPV